MKSDIVDPPKATTMSSPKVVIGDPFIMLDSPVKPGNDEKKESFK
jgi:hypothetical protein